MRISNYCIGVNSNTRRAQLKTGRGEGLNEIKGNTVVEHTITNVQLSKELRPIEERLNRIYESLDRLAVRFDGKHTKVLDDLVNLEHQTEGLEESINETDDNLIRIDKKSLHHAKRISELEMELLNLRITVNNSMAKVEKPQITTNSHGAILYGVHDGITELRNQILCLNEQLEREKKESRQANMNYNECSRKLESVKSNLNTAVINEHVARDKLRNALDTIEELRKKIASFTVPYSTVPYSLDTQCR